MGLHTSDDYPELTNYDISEKYIKCEEYTRQLLTDMRAKQGYQNIYTSYSVYLKIFMIILTMAHLEFAMN